MRLLALVSIQAAQACSPHRTSTFADKKNEMKGTCLTIRTPQNTAATGGLGWSLTHHILSDDPDSDLHRFLDAADTNREKGWVKVGIPYDEVIREKHQHQCWIFIFHRHQGQHYASAAPSCLYEKEVIKMIGGLSTNPCWAAAARQVTSSTWRACVRACVCMCSSPPAGCVHTHTKAAWSAWLLLTRPAAFIWAEQYSRC